MPSSKLFATQIYSAPLESRGSKKLNKELLEEAYQIRDYDEDGQAWSKKNYLGGYTSYSSMAQLHMFSSTFASLEKKFRPHLKKYIQSLALDVKVDQLFMTDCWLNIMPQSVAHSSHIHPLSFVSGTYYVSTPNKAAPITFEDPRIACFMNRPAPKSTAKSAQLHCRHRAKEGSLVLFESWLRHEVPASSNKSDRVSISFNYNWN